MTNSPFHDEGCKKRYKAGISLLTDEIVKLNRRVVELEIDIYELVGSIPEDSWAIVLTQIVQPQVKDRILKVLRELNG